MTPTQARLLHRTQWLHDQRPDLLQQLADKCELAQSVCSSIGTTGIYYDALHQWLDTHRIPEFYAVGQIASCIGNDTHKARLVRRVMWMAEHKGQFDQVMVQRYRMIENSDRDNDPRMMLVHDVLTGMGVPELYTNDYEYPVLWGTNNDRT